MRPIFIGGAERSGTTFLGSLFGCIRGACVAPESVFKHAVPFNAADPVGYRLRLNAFWRLHAWNVGDVTDIPLGSERDFYIELLRRYAGKVPDYWVDHTPSNVLQMRHLKAAYPDAKFIHLIRDGRAVAASIMPLEWGPNTPAAAARLWIKDVGAGVANSLSRPDDMMTVHYEDVVRDPVATLNRLFAFCGLDKRLETMEDLVLRADFVPSFAQVGQHRDVGRPPNPVSIDRWRSQLSDADVIEYEAIAGPMLEAMGYDLAGGGRSPAKQQLAISEATNLWRHFVTNPAKFRRLRNF